MQIAKKVQSGFTLIELMIVVAIIGILASIAIPQYQDFINKSTFKEITSLAAGDFKVGVELCAQEKNDITFCDADWRGRLGSIGQNLAGVDFDPNTPNPDGVDLLSMTVVDGVITATTGASGRYGAAGDGVTYILTPIYTPGVMGIVGNTGDSVAGSILWEASGTAITDAGLATY